MRTWTCLAGLLALLLGLMPCPVSAAPSAYHLSKVVMLTRHGVAAPADDNQLPRITGKAWPQWPVGPGQISPRGAQLLTAQWASLRALYIQADLLPAQKTESRVFVRADNTPRSRGTAEALLRGLTPGTLPAYAVVNLDPDPLFEPVQAGLAIFDPAETALAILDHINGDFSQFWESLGEPMSLLDQLAGPLSAEACNSINLPGGCRLSDMVPTISIMDMGRRVEIRGGLGLGSTLVDLLVQEYAQWPQQEAAWGQANAAALRKLLPIRSESCRRLVYSLLILGTTALAWAAILLCDDGTFTLLHFSHRLTIAFRMDGAARLFAGLSATLWPFTMLYGFDYMRHEKHLHMFWAFFTASFGVTLGIAFSANMMTMYLFYELLTLATLPLVMQPMTKAAKKAGIKYLVYSISGAALAFIGLVFLAIHDASDFSLGGHLAGYDGDLSMLLAVFSLSFVGFGVKAAIWPLHGWLPSAAVAPTPVTALLHAVAVVKAGAFACIRLIYYSFGPDILSGTWAQQLALLLPIITIVYGSCMSLKQRHFKLRLAYSTVSNLSYILFAAALMTTQALAASFLHLIVHSVVKIMAFFTAGAVLHYAHREYVPQLEGLARYMPVTFACFTAAACALTGIPPFNGFVSKWYIARAAVDIGGWLPLVGFAALLVSALLTAVYMFQVVMKAWFPRTDAPAIPEGSAHEAGWMMTVPTAVLAAACLVMGLFPQWLLDVIGKAVGL